MIRRSRECVRVREHLDAFADNELTRRECAAVVMHLAKCTMCTDELLSIRELTNMFADMPTVSSEHDLTLKVQQVVAASLMRTGTFASATRIGAAARTGVAVSATQIGAGGASQLIKLANKPGRFDLKNIWRASTWQCATYVCAATVFALGFWASWEIPDGLMNLFETTRTRSVLVPSDCYVASRKAVINHAQAMINRAQVSSDGGDDESTSLTAEMGLKTDEDGLYVVEM